jgi:ribosomal protein L23
MNNEEIIKNDSNIVETVTLFDGAVTVPKDQNFKHVKISAKKKYNVYNPKFSQTVANPVITEKSMAMTEDGYYTFKVDKTATKYQIVHSLELMFGIAVVEIKTIRSGTMTAYWNRNKKKKNIKKEITKKALVKFNPAVELNMEKIQSMMDNRQNIMRS